MPNDFVRGSLCLMACLAATACAGPARLPVSAGMGFHPVLPPPEEAKGVKTAIGAARAKLARGEMKKAS